MRIIRLIVVAGAVCTGVVSLSACGPIDEKVCSDGSYPVTGADGAGGSTCVKSGEPSPSGYTTYAPGHTPSAS